MEDRNDEGHPKALRDEVLIMELEANGFRFKAWELPDGRTRVMFKTAVGADPSSDYLEYAMKVLEVATRRRVAASRA